MQVVLASHPVFCRLHLPKIVVDLEAHCQASRCSVVAVEMVVFASVVIYVHFELF